ncbi:MAG: hypothetical protein DRI61_14650 [Chloroflexi bacterium]|nr:MAG: hypothetical protein DRI61_14650 [Chloroflexota bacterium]
MLDKLPELRRRFRAGFTINISWVLALVLIGWVALAVYVVFTSAMEVSKANLELTATYREKSVQERIKQELEDKARILKVEVPGTPTPTPAPNATREVLAPSEDALLKEEMRRRNLVHPGEHLVPLPDISERFPHVVKPSPTPGYVPERPLEAWKALLGLTSPGE